MADLAPVLIGLAHGSRHPGVRAAVDDLLAGVSELAGPPVRTVTAFLDLVEPDLGAVCEQLAATGTTAATVVPLLFTNAFHATVDVPDAVAAVVAASGVTLTTAAIIGTDDAVLDVLERALDLAGVPADRRVLLFSVGSSRPAANDAVADLGTRLARRRGAAVLTGFGTSEPRGSALLEQLRPGDAVLPLFFSPGLLLDPMAAACAERGLAMVPPLGRLLAPVVLQRFRTASRDAGPADQVR